MNKERLINACWLGGEKKPAMLLYSNFILWKENGEMYTNL